MTKQKSVKVEWLLTKDLKAAPFNPEIRTLDKSLKDLMRSMETHGFWGFKPIVVTSDNTIVDGHRRWTAAKNLGIVQVACIRTDMGLQECWAETMASTRPINAQELFQAVRDGLEVLPKNNSGNTVSRYINKYGKGLVDYMADRGLSSSPIMYAERTCVYLGKEQSRENVEKIAKWIVENKLSRQILYIISDGVAQVPREDLEKLIERNEPPRYEKPE